MMTYHSVLSAMKLYKISFGAMLLLSFLLCSSQVEAQGNWIWKWGPQVTAPLSSVGQGVFSSTNSPNYRYASQYWKDNNENFWRYGGDGSSDMWQYSQTLNQWAHMSGSLTAVFAPVYGTQGVSNVNNTPGSSQFGSPAWTDTMGNLWLYGLSFSDDLWRYDVNTNSWAWMKGSAGGGIATYGTQGIASSLNSPGLINEVNCKWVDSNNNLWLFNHLDGILWKYSMTNNMWTWMKGVPSATVPNYGFLGTYSSASNPSTFNACPSVGTLYTMWQNKNDNMLMLVNRVGQGNALYLENWEYSVALNQWRCLRIDTSSFSSSPAWSNSCTELPNVFPNPRTEMRAFWVDGCDNLWVFGGGDFCSPSTDYNDIWRLNAQTNNWMWVRGSNLPVNYGVQNVASSSNMPYTGHGQQSWTTKDGFWLTGGQVATNSPHHLWLYSPDSVQAAFTYTSTNCTSFQFQNTSSSGCNTIKSSLWNFDDPLSGLNDSSTLSNPVHTFSAPGTYQVTLIVENCTWDLDTIIQQVIVTGFNVSLSTTPATNCLANNGSVTVVPLGGVPPFTYNWQPINQNTSTVNNLGVGVYMITVTDSLNCSRTDTISVQLVLGSTPSITTSQTNVLCNGGCTGSSQAIVTGGLPPFTYQWSNSQVGSTAINLCAGNYVVVLTDSNFCTDTAIVAITEPPILQNLITTSNACLPNLPSASVSVWGGTQPYNYLWIPGTFNTAAITNLVDTLYTLQVTDANGCVLTDTANVRAYDVPTAQGVTTDATCYGQCDGMASLAISNGTPPYAVLWSTSSSQLSVQNLCSGTYNYTISDSNSCTTTGSVNINEPDSISIRIISTESGCTKNFAVSTATISGGTPPFKILWSNNQSGNPTTDLPTGNHSILVTDSNGCSKTQTFIINQTSQPTVTIQVNPDSLVILGNSVLLSTFGALDYFWYPDENLSCVNCQTTRALPTNDILYCVAGTDSNGCIDTACINILVNDNCKQIFIPNAFTPNNDGLNDLFSIKSLCLKEYQLKIFNRWGQNIFSSASNQNRWDGNYQGVPQEIGTYFYILKGTFRNDEKVNMRGDISLIR